MKLRYYIPLFIFVALMIWGMSSNPPTTAMALLQFLMFIVGYVNTFLFGIKGTIKDAEPILKTHTKSPYIIPAVLFFIPTIILTVILIPRNAMMIFGFAIAFLAALFYR
ncbi:MAG: hypothetical protein JW841_14560 [Deltaproteobacteria bacterium]|nr:hypothetical protein [Deltaproteobacteria bacterium]